MRICDDKEFQFFVLASKGGETLNGRFKILQTFHCGDGVGLALKAFSNAPGHISHEAFIKLQEGQKKGGFPENDWDWIFLKP